jgi:hypothetical protein
LPSIIPSYLYMFAAMIAVGTLLIFSFNSYAATLRSVPETEQLDNLLNHVAAKATELLTQTKTDSNARITLNLPIRIGDRDYWIRLQNDSIQSWVEGGFGEIWNDTVSHKVFFPNRPAVAGHYISGFGAAVLKCYMNGSVLQLLLTNTRDE